MNIILVSGRLAKAKTITLSWPYLALLAGGVVAAVITLAAMLHFATFVSPPSAIPPPEFLAVPRAGTAARKIGPTCART